MTSTGSEMLWDGWPPGSSPLCGASTVGDFCHKVAAVLQSHSQPLRRGRVSWIQVVGNAGVGLSPQRAGLCSCVQRGRRWRNIQLLVLSRI